MPLNSNGVSNSTGKQLLQIVPINIVVVLTVVGTAVGLYWKFDARISSLEKSASSTELTARVTSMEKKIDESSEKMNDTTQRIIRIDTNMLWLMSKQQGSLK